jgi:hypothetical protein
MREDPSDARIEERTSDGATENNDVMNLISSLPLHLRALSA